MPLLMKNILNAALSCRFQSMYIQPLMLSMTTTSSRSCQAFGECTKRKPGLLGLVDCLPLLTRSCSKAKASVVKTVRLSMERAATLLKADSKVKVIHLVRDPRAVLKSRRTSGIARTYATTPKKFCSTVLKDLKVCWWLEMFHSRVL